MATVAFNLRNLAPVRAELARASEQLAVSDELTPEVVGVLRSVAHELAGAEQDLWEEDIDPALLSELRRIGIAALLALDGDEEQARIEEVELALEALQDVLADIADAAEVGDERPAREIVTWLRDRTGVSNRELAALLAVSPRKLDRWIAGDTDPAGEDEMRLRIAARLVNQLRHAMTGYGAARWLARPFPELRDRAPKELLASPENAPQLFALASRSRRSDAS